MPDADFIPLRITYQAPKLGHTQIRDWARANGYPVSDRGRMAPEIMEAFFADHPEILEQASTFEMVRATARTPARHRRITHGKEAADSERSTRSSSYADLASARCSIDSVPRTRTSG